MKDTAAVFEATQDKI